MPRIREIHAVPVSIPLTEPFAIAGGAPSAARNVFVRAVLSDGAVGYGEAAPFTAVSGETQASTLSAIRAAAPALLGRPLGEASPRPWAMPPGPSSTPPGPSSVPPGPSAVPPGPSAVPPGPSAVAPGGLAWLPAGWAALRPQLPAAPAARCALEQALLAATGLPEFTGNFMLKTDITIPAGSIAQATAAARRAACSGFDTVKVKAGATDWHTDAARVRAIHAAEPQLAIIVDANGAYTLPDARAFLAALPDDLELALFEQPLPPEADLSPLTTAARICADESVRSPADAHRAAAQGVSAINIKLMKLGVTDALAVAEIARAAAVPCMIGGMIETALSMSYSAALAAADPSLFRYIDLDTPLFMPPNVVTAPLHYAGPTLTLTPARPDASHWFPARPDASRWFPAHP